jgi:hypothetical protein
MAPNMITVGRNTSQTIRPSRLSARNMVNFFKRQLITPTNITLRVARAAQGGFRGQANAFSLKLCVFIATSMTIEA